MNTEPIIRIATVQDAPALREIYLPYVRTTAVTFEIDDPSEEEFARRITHTLSAYPYLVAEANGEILGYAYASAFRPRAAYRHAAETSIYVRMDYKGNGLGKRLYEALACVLALQNVYTMEACIAHADPPDEFVPATSRAFHERRGFTQAALFRKCAHKFGRWYDMIWMERVIAERPDVPEPFAPFPTLDPARVTTLLATA